MGLSSSKSRQLSEWLLALDHEISVPSQCTCAQGNYNSKCSYCLYVRPLNDKAHIVCELVRDQVCQDLERKPREGHKTSVIPIGSFPHGVKILRCDEFDFMIVFDITRHKQIDLEYYNDICCVYEEVMTGFTSKIAEEICDCTLKAAYKHGPAWCLELEPQMQDMNTFSVDITLGIRQVGKRIKDSVTENDYLSCPVLHSMVKNLTEDVIYIHTDRSLMTSAHCHKDIFKTLNCISTNILSVYRLLKLFTKFLLPQKLKKTLTGTTYFSASCLMSPHDILIILLKYMKDKPDKADWPNEKTARRTVDLMEKICEFVIDKFHNTGDDSDYKVLRYSMEHFSSDIFSIIQNDNLIVNLELFEFETSFIKVDRYRKVTGMEDITTCLRNLSNQEGSLHGFLFRDYMSVHFFDKQKQKLNQFMKWNQDTLILILSKAPPLTDFIANHPDSGRSFMHDNDNLSNSISWTSSSLEGSYHDLHGSDAPFEEQTTWNSDHEISAVAISEKHHLVYVGHGNTKPDYTGEPISVYTFTGQLVNRIKDNCSYPSVAIDTRRDLILCAAVNGVRTFTADGELVQTITSPEIKHLADICYQVDEDRYVVADTVSRCIHFICAQSGEVLKSVHAKEARDTACGNRNVYIACSSHSSRLVTVDFEDNLVSLYDKEGNYMGSYTGSETDKFKSPTGICFDHLDRILVCDSDNHLLIRIDLNTGSHEVIMDTWSGLGQPARVDVTGDGLLVMAFCNDPDKGPFKLNIFTRYQ